MSSDFSLTLQTIGVEQILALLVAFDSTLGAAHALAGDPPQQSLALVAVRGRGGCPHLKVVWRGAGDGVNEGLEGLLVNMALLEGGQGREMALNFSLGLE